MVTQIHDFPYLPQVKVRHGDDIAAHGYADCVIVQVSRGHNAVCESVCAQSRQRYVGAMVDGEVVIVRKVLRASHTSPSVRPVAGMQCFSGAVWRARLCWTNRNNQQSQLPIPNTFSPAGLLESIV